MSSQQVKSDRKSRRAAERATTRAATRAARTASAGPIVLILPDGAKSGERDMSLDEIRREGIAMFGRERMDLFVAKGPTFTVAEFLDDEHGKDGKIIEAPYRRQRIWGMSGASWAEAFSRARTARVAGTPRGYLNCDGPDGALDVGLFAEVN